MGKKYGWISLFREKFPTPVKGRRTFLSQLQFVKFLDNAGLRFGKRI